MCVRFTAGAWRPLRLSFLCGTYMELCWIQFAARWRHIASWVPSRFPAQCLVLALALAAREVAGQEHTAGRALAARLAVVRTGTTVRVALGARRLEGQLVSATSDSLYFRTFTVPGAHLDAAWIRGRSTARGAWAGGVIGGVSGALLLRALVLGLCDTADRCAEDELPALGIGFALGGAGGAVVGAGIGAFVPRWRRVKP